MKIDWLALWDLLRDVISTKSTWTQAEITAEMDKLERKALRSAAREEQL